jgi:hypothetical protein
MWPSFTYVADQYKFPCHRKRAFIVTAPAFFIYEYFGSEIISAMRLPVRQFYCGKSDKVADASHARRRMHVASARPRVEIAKRRIHGRASTPKTE